MKFFSLLVIVALMSKDADFVRLIEDHNIPPQLIWITCGDTSNSRLCQILLSTLSDTIELLTKSEKMVEIAG